MRKVVTTLFAAFTSLISCAQFYTGPELGFNAIMLYEDGLGKHYQPGWFTGGMAEYKFNDYFSLRSGIYFSQHKQYNSTKDTSQFEVFGFDPEDLGLSGVDFSVYANTRTTISQFGIEVPVLASFNYYGVSIFAGPYFHFMTHAWTKEIKDTHIPFLQTFNIDSLDPTGFLSFLFPPAESSSFSESSSKENLRVVDYGLKLGAAYSVDGFMFNLYYTLGIPSYLTTDENGPNHSYFTTSIGWKFGFKKKGQSSLQ
ncbi:MAG: outer membrane beta-barrel protein [Crocinitomicaceae bacterium]|nr:outer membrane beta-barrel protein [Crocinitomicaceae bacterium]MBK8927959.1 outer membrane beta-barrel protein [Crocinitomicaceae bacterium]